jgi:hypothetical protein
MLLLSSSLAAFSLPLLNATAFFWSQMTASSYGCGSVSNPSFYPNLEVSVEIPNCLEIPIRLCG